jgi:hypothetical protein
MRQYLPESIRILCRGTNKPRGARVITKIAQVKRTISVMYDDLHVKIRENAEGIQGKYDRPNSWCTISMYQAEHEAKHGNGSSEGKGCLY